MFETVTPRSIYDTIVSNLDTELLSVEGSFTYDLLAPAVLEIYRAYKAMDAMEPMFYVDATSGAYLDRMAEIFGLTRKAGTKASCSIALSGDDGAVIPAGTIFCTADSLKFVLDADVTLTGGSGAGTLTAEQTGTQYNVEAGGVARTQSVVPGLVSWTSGAATGGTDEESSASLCDRLYTLLRTPPTSGNAYHYQQWARSVAGVGAARVVGLWDGPGTVKVLLANDSMHAASADAVSAAAAVIAQERPVGAAVTVAAAEEVQVSVSAAVTISGDVTLASVTAQLQAALDVYFYSLVVEGYRPPLNADADDLSAAGIVVSYHKLATLLMECDGVLDYSGLTVNGGTANLTLGLKEIPVRGTVTLT